MEESKYNTIRKRKSRENESSEYRETCISKQRKKPQQKRVIETAEERDAHCAYDCE